MCALEEERWSVVVHGPLSCDPYCRFCSVCPCLRSRQPTINCARAARIDVHSHHSAALIDIVEVLTKQSVTPQWRVTRDEQQIVCREPRLSRNGFQWCSRVRALSHLALFVFYAAFARCQLTRCAVPDSLSVRPTPCTLALFLARGIYLHVGLTCAPHL